LVLATLITANLAGLFELPSLPIRSGGQSSAFATGLLAALVATPCTGPFMAAALGAALILPPMQALLLFAALGLGLALPFLLLGFVPALRSLLPKPGPWMERFRRILSIPMGLTALALLWLAFRLAGVHFAFSALALGVLPIVAITAFGRNNRAVGWIGVTAAFYFAVSLPFRIDTATASEADSVLDPVPYSEEALAEARAAGSPVFLWFTADWCLTCKVNERVAIEREATRAAFEEAGVVAMRGDWTRTDPAITRYLEEQGVAGVPLYVWYPAGGTGEQLSQSLGPDTLVKLAER
ncbi:MAG: thioredoxin family protein, partial [Alteraurantiacibacter sp.]